jgi:DNA-binding XRE family transcriptional regulator
VDDNLLAIAYTHLLAMTYSIDTMKKKSKPEKIDEELATILRKRRKKLGKSQEDVAHEAGIDRSYLSEIECGKVSVSIAFARRIAKVLNTSLSHIMREIETRI